MAYRGPGLSYKIRKTTMNNKTGDNYSITIPRIIAKKFEECFFRLYISGNCIVFESGCKITTEDLSFNTKQKIKTAGGMVSFE